MGNISFMQIDNLKRVFITGANTGIGFALCKLIASEKDSFVYMGSRSLERGNAAIESLIKECPKLEGKVELVEVDVSSPNSITNAAN